MTHRRSRHIAWRERVEEPPPHLFLILGCLHLIGGPYAILQVYAWTNMLVSYSQESTLTQAVSDETYAATHGVMDNAAGVDQSQFLPGDGRSVFAGLEWTFF